MKQQSELQRLDSIDSFLENKVSTHAERIDQLQSEVSRLNDSKLGVDKYAVFLEGLERALLEIEDSCQTNQN